MAQSLSKIVFFQIFALNIVIIWQNLVEVTQFWEEMSRFDQKRVISVIKIYVFHQKDRILLVNIYIKIFKFLENNIFGFGKRNLSIKLNLKTKVTTVMIIFMQLTKKRDITWLEFSVIKVFKTFCNWNWLI